MSGRILLLSPPSLASQPERLNAAIQSYDREATDLQMLDRLALGMVILPDSTYSNIIILAGKNDSFSESSSLIKRQTFARIAQSLKRGGYICSQHGIHGEAFDHNEAILAGLIHAGTGRFMKPDVGEIQAVPLRLCRSKNDSAGASSSHQSSREYRSSSAVVQGRDFDNKSVNVGFPDFDHSINLVTTVNGSDDSDAEIIDEDGLLDNSEPVAPTVQPLGCRPKSGKRRRACKDCTCGLSQKLEEEDAVRRANADKQLDSMKLSHGDLAEVDFTAQGRVGSCGNCSLGDAFRCEGCPFIGLPAFQPGEEIRLLNNDAQL